MLHPFWLSSGAVVVVVVLAGVWGCLVLVVGMVVVGGAVDLVAIASWLIWLRDFRSVS